MKSTTTQFRVLEPLPNPITLFLSLTHLALNPYLLPGSLGCFSTSFAIQVPSTQLLDL